MVLFNSKVIDVEKGCGKIAKLERERDKPAVLNSQPETYIDFEFVMDTHTSNRYHC